MQSLFLAPATPRSNAYSHFQTTILEGVNQDFYRYHVDSDYGEEAKIWGLTSSIESTWESIEPGDWVLYYTDKNKYTYAAKVRGTERSPELGEKIRSRLLESDKGSENRDWTYLIFFKELTPIKISGEETAKLLEYSNDFPVRFLRVTEDRLQRVIQRYGSLSEFIESIKIDT